MSAASHFFAAPSDETAAMVLSRSIEEIDPQWLLAKGIDPLEALPRLEVMVTGQPLGGQQVDAGDAPIALDKDEGLVLLAVSEQLTVALAGSDSDRLAEISDRWSRLEHFHGRARPEDLSEGLRDLAVLARRAIGQGLKVYALFLAE